MFGFFFPDSLYLQRVLRYDAVATVGMGVSFPSVMMFAMSDATGANSGLVSGLVNTTAQVGGAFGLAILATAAAARSHSEPASGTRELAALGAGYHFAFGVAAACMVTAGIVAATVLQPEARRRA